jgi:hypothetical protein
MRGSPTLQSKKVFPAQAGVFLSCIKGATSGLSLPRAGGGVSVAGFIFTLCDEPSLRIRGCFQRTFELEQQRRVFPA